MKNDLKYSFFLKSLILVWTAVLLLSVESSFYYQEYYYIPAHSNICQLADINSFYDQNTYNPEHSGSHWNDVNYYTPDITCLSIDYNNKIKTRLKTLSELDLPLFIHFIKSLKPRFSNSDDEADQII